MSWAAHEFENYFIHDHLTPKISFLAIVLGTFSPDLFTKFFVYESSNPAQFHRGWPGVGFTHSFIFGVLLSILVLAITKDRAWALGILIGQWLHVITDVADSAGVMFFFPFTTDSASINMWKHAASQGRYGDAAAYYSSLGGMWDLFWCAMVLIFARAALTKDYFLKKVVTSDPGAWQWLKRKVAASRNGLYAIYCGFFFYGLTRMITWFALARFRERAPLDLSWGGPSFVGKHDLSESSFLLATWNVVYSGVLFGLLLAILWKLFVRKLWLRAGYSDASAEI